LNIYYFNIQNQQIRLSIHIKRFKKEKKNLKMVVITETKDVFFGQLLEGQSETTSPKKIEIKPDRMLSITMASLDTSLASK
jgi:hypothetical protein